MRMIDQRRIDWGSDWTRTPVCVLADNVADYLQSTDADPVAQMCVKPPFDEIWIEWTEKQPAEYRRAAVYVKRLPDFIAMGPEPNERMTETMRRTAAEYSTRIKPILDAGGAAYLWDQMCDRHDDWAKASQYQFVFGSDGRLVDGERYRVPDQLSGKLNEHITAVALWALSFMHCKNVEVEDENRSSDLVRALTKRRGMRPMQFKTLRIVPMENYRRGERRPAQGGDTALHIVRGHFKDYRKRGLFGMESHRGIYWWNQSLSGTADRFVDKQYEVEAPRVS